MKYSKSYPEILNDQINQKNKYDEDIIKMKSEY